MFEGINKIIVKYIAENRRIIVPQLGAFMRKDDGNVVFVEFLKRSDGVLQALLRNNTTLNEAQVNVVIEEFVTKVKSDIEQQGSYVVEGLGSMFRGKDGICELSYDPNIKRVEAVAVQVPVADERRVAPERVERVDVPETRKIIADQVAPETIADRLAREVHYREVPAEGAHKVKKSDNTTKTPVVSAPVRRVDDTRSEVPKKIKQEGVRGQTTPKRNPLPRPQQRPPRAPEQKKKRADLVMIIAIVAALLAIAAMVFGMWSDNNPLTKIRATAPVEQVEQGESVDNQGAESANEN